MLRSLYQPRVCRLTGVELRRFPADTLLAVPDGEEFYPVWGDAVAEEQVNPGRSADRLQQEIAECGEREFINDSAVVIGRYGLRTWGHWLGELLPKLLCVEAIRPGRHRYILPRDIVDDAILGTALESLGFHGIGRERLILLRPRRRYAFAELLAVTSVWSDHMIHPGAVEIMRNFHSREARETSEKVALLRRESHTRNLANVEDVQRYLRSHGWCVVDIGKSTFAEQVGLFRGASSIISVLGSSLAGLIYSPPEVKVITLAPIGWADRFFFAIMQNRRASLADLRGLKSPDDARPVAIAKFQVSVEDIERGMRGLRLLPPRS